MTRKHFDDESKAELLFALRQSADNFEGTPIPASVSQTFKQLKTATIPNYIETSLTNTAGVPLEHEQPVSQLHEQGLESLLGTFQKLWNTTLTNETFQKLSVCEPACGSANDYRFLESYGIARFLNYTGFDLCEKNIHNACTMFPKVRFDVGNAMHLELPDKSVDCCFVHDLFEHLSIEAMEQSLAETCRVTRSAIALNFFSMHEAEDHIIRPVEDYHWNTLSLDKIRTLLAAHGFETQSIHIATFLKTCFAHLETHNPNAYTLIARERGL